MNHDAWPEFLLHLTGRVTFAAACACVNAWLYSWIVDAIAWQLLNLHPHPHLLYHIYSFWIFLPIFFLIGMFATDVEEGLHHHRRFSRTLVLDVDPPGVRWWVGLNRHFKVVHYQMFRAGSRSLRPQELRQHRMINNLAQHPHLKNVWRASSLGALAVPRLYPLIHRRGAD